jgi:hypothetical protein
MRAQALLNVALNSPKEDKDRINVPALGNVLDMSNLPRDSRPASKSVTKKGISKKGRRSERGSVGYHR